MRTRSVVVVLYDGVQSLDVTGPLEVFAGAGAAAGQPGAYRVTLAAAGGGPVRSSSGLRLLPDGDLAGVGPVHTLLVPGGEGTQAPDPALVARIQQLAGRAERVVSVCTGAFLLAEAGLLAGRRATTHWAYCDSLARRFPDVEVDPDPIHVRDGRVATSAGVSAGIDLALTLTGRLAGDVTAEAIQLVIEYDPQPPYSAGSLATAPAGLADSLRSSSLLVR